MNICALGQYYTALSHDLYPLHITLAACLATLAGNLFRGPAGQSELGAANRGDSNARRGAVPGTLN